MTIKELYGSLSNPETVEIHVFTEDGNTVLAGCNGYYQYDGTTPDPFPYYDSPYSMKDIENEEVKDLGVGYNSLWIHVAGFEKVPVTIFEAMRRMPKETRELHFKEQVALCASCDLGISDGTTGIWMFSLNGGNIYDNMSTIQNEFRKFVDMVHIKHCCVTSLFLRDMEDGTEVELWQQ